MRRFLLKEAVPHSQRIIDYEKVYDYIEILKATQESVHRSTEGNPARNRVSDAGVALGFLEAAPPQPDIAIEVPGSTIISRQFRRAVARLPYDTKTVYAMKIEPQGPTNPDFSRAVNKKC